MTPAYRMREISFHYGGSPVLEANDLQIESGEIVALAGPNGAGKTTLLHILAFVVAPSSGDVFFFNERLVKQNVLSFRRRVGLLLQNPYLFNTTVLKNIIWGLKLRGHSSSEAKDKASESLQRVGLSGFEYRDARRLSGGETQRVALSRALALDPDVLLLDEPANHMDRESISRTLDVVQESNEKHGTTVLLATHDMPMVQHMVHRVIHLRQGKIVPSLPENLFSGTLSEDGSVFQTEKISVRLPNPVLKGSHVAIDPTKIKIWPTISQSSSPNSFSGRVVSLINENNSAVIGIDAGEYFRVRADADSSLVADLHLGQHVSITLQSDGMCVF